jgi:hypothetical protein
VNGGRGVFTAAAIGKLLFGRRASHTRERRAAYENESGEAGTIDGVCLRCVIA